MNPVYSNEKKKCASSISSNCVAYDGCNIPGLCKPATVSDAICAIQSYVNEQIAIQNGFINQQTGALNVPCYTGNWVPFTATIPPAGSSGSLNWTLSNFGNSRGFSSVTNTEDVPGYKFNRIGNLMLRGTMEFAFAPFIGTEVVTINLGTVPGTCLPVGMKDQSVLIAIDSVDDSQRFIIFCQGTIRLTSAGILQLLVSVRSIGLGPGRYIMGLGGVTFNF